jgi:hypothetical protein
MADLEGLSGCGVYADSQVHGGLPCPRFGNNTITDVACEQRQEMYVKTHNEHLCAGFKCPRWLEGEMEEHPKQERAVATASRPVVGGLEIPEGAVVTSSGRVQKGRGYILPCPKCNERWMAVNSKTCLPCAEVLAAAKMREKKRQKQAKVGAAAERLASFQVTHTHLQDPPPPAPILDTLIEELAQQIVAKAKARAAQILGITP